MTVTPSIPTAPPFEEHLHTAVQGFRAALAEVTAQVGADATRPQQLARQLGFDKSLAWHLASLLGGDELPAMVGHLPGRAGMRIVVQGFERAGASVEALEALRSSIDELDRMVETHCGDRKTLEMMAAHVTDGTGHAGLEAHRKRFVEGAAAIWGVRAEVQLSAHFMAPSRDAPELLDNAIISGLIGFRRLRADVPWAVASVRQYGGDDASRATDQRVEAVDPAVGPGEAPLLAEFCSQPPPALRIAPGPPGVTRYEIVEGPVGNTATCTAISAWVWRAGVSPWRTETDRFGEHFVHLSTPVKLLVHDLFVHRDVPFSLPPQADLYSQLPGGPVFPAGGRDRGRLPLANGVIDLGSGPPDAVAPEVPRYQTMIERVCERLGHPAAEFAGFRLRLPYPPIPALAVLRHELPRRAG